MLWKVEWKRVPRPRHGYFSRRLLRTCLRVPEVGGDVVAQLPELERDYLADHGWIRGLRPESHGLGCE